MTKKYLVTISMNDKSKTFETTDLAQSFIDFKPSVIKTVVRIAVEYGDKKVERVLYVMRAKRVFYNPFTAKVFARDIERALI